MTVKEIIIKYLEDHGYEGLYKDDCGCHKDDLFPCGEDFQSCKAGYVVPCDCGEGCEYHIGSWDQRKDNA